MIQEGFRFNECPNEEDSEGAGAERTELSRYTAAPAENGERSTLEYTGIVVTAAVHTRLTCTIRSRSTRSQVSAANYQVCRRCV